MIETKRIRLSALLIFFVTLTLFGMGLSTQEVTAFDTRFYLFAQEMLQQGWGWFPTTYGDLYPDYPGTSTAMIVGLAKIFGGLSKTVAELPTIFFAGLMASFTYLIGCLQRERLGWAAVFFLFLTLFFLRTIRSISLDMMIAAITTMVFYLVYAHDVQEKSRQVLWIYPLFVLGFFIRGPIGLVMPVGVMCAYYAATSQWRVMVKRGLVALILLILCVGLLMLLALHAGGSAFLNDVLRMQVFGRLELATLPRYFYMKDSFGSYALAYPVAVLVLFCAVFHWVRSRVVTVEMRYIFIMAGWMLVVLLGMSVPADKKVRYVLPMLPACALIAASFYTMQERWLQWFKKSLVILFFVLPTIFFVAVCWIKYTNDLRLLSLPVNFTFCMMMLASAQIVQCVFLIKRNKQNLSLCLLGVAAVSFVIFYLGVMEPIQLHIDRAREVVQEIERLRKRDHAELVFYREGRDSLPIKYIINMPQADKPMFVSSLNELRALRKPVYVVTSTSYANDIEAGLMREYQKIMTAKLAHVDIVVYTRRWAHE